MDHYPIDLKLRSYFLIAQITQMDDPLTESNIPKQAVFQGKDMQSQIYQCKLFLFVGGWLGATNIVKLPRKTPNGSFT